METVSPTWLSDRRPSTLERLEVFPRNEPRACHVLQPLQLTLVVINNYNYQIARRFHQQFEHTLEKRGIDDDCVWRVALQDLVE